MTLSYVAISTLILANLTLLAYSALLVRENRRQARQNGLERSLNRSVEKQNRRLAEVNASNATRLREEYERRFGVALPEEDSPPRPPHDA